jgi:hypothetical protein
VVALLHGERQSRLTAATAPGRDSGMAAVGCMANRRDWQVQGDAITGS